MYFSGLLNLLRFFVFVSLLFFLKLPSAFCAKATQVIDLAFDQACLIEALQIPLVNGFALKEDGMCYLGETTLEQRKYFIFIVQNALQKNAFYLILKGEGKSFPYLFDKVSLNEIVPPKHQDPKYNDVKDRYYKSSLGGLAIYQHAAHQFFWPY